MGIYTCKHMETTTEDRRWGMVKKKRLNLDWCTCIEQMQRFTILFLWNKKSCVLHKGFI